MPHHSTQADPLHRPKYAPQHSTHIDLQNQNLVYPELGLSMAPSNLENAAMAAQEQEVVISQEQLARIREELANLLNTLDDRQSFISRLANIWGPLPLWKKVCFGLLLSSPSLAIGVVTNVAPLLALTGFTLFTYLGGGMALDNHHHCNRDTISRIRTNVLSLSNMLEIVIVSLDNIRRYFQNEVEKFKAENNRFSDSLRDFMLQTQQLFGEVESLNTTDQSLKKRREDLELTIEKLKTHSKIDKDQLKEYKLELFQICENYKKNQLELADTTSNLERVRNQLQDQVMRSEKATASLKRNLDTVLELAVGGEERRQKFQERVEEFIENKEISFDTIAARLCDVEENLAADNVKYAELLSQQEIFIEKQHILIGALEKQIKELKIRASDDMKIGSENQVDKAEHNQAKPEKKQAVSILSAINRIGLYARQKLQKTEPAQPSKGDLSPSESVEEEVIKEAPLEMENNEAPLEASLKVKNNEERLKAENKETFFKRENSRVSFHLENSETSSEEEEEEEKVMALA